MASEEDLAAVLMGGFMQLRGLKISAQTHEPFEPTALGGQGWVQVGYMTRQVEGEGCPVGGVILTTMPNPQTFQLSVADKFTWCD